MYIAVEDVESRYGIIGATHYSLVGERSLFRVIHLNFILSERVGKGSMLIC